jgi:hypothetical protein
VNDEAIKLLYSATLFAHLNPTPKSSQEGDKPFL